MKKILAIMLTVVLMSTLLLMDVTPVSAATNCLEPMVCYSLTDHYCGPSSGVSIGQYYRNRSASTYGRNYPNLPIGVDDDPDAYNDMYNRLYDYMDTAILGTTYPDQYGPGFVEMALHYGYDDFSYIHYGPDTDAGPVTWDFYDDVIKNAIDNGWPVALASMGLLVGFKDVPALPGSDGNGSWPCTVWHWIAIEGYCDNYLPGHARVIRCTDNYSHADHLYLDWDTLWNEVGKLGFLEAVIVKDVDDTPDGPAVEDFEWGNDGDSLSAWGGEVDWEVTASGASVAEIETDPYYVHTGTRSARFYRTGGKVVRAYYSLRQPSYISFWVRKEGTAYASFINGSGSPTSKIIDVKFNSAEELRYYTGSAYIYVTTLSSPTAWYHIEFKNINWTTTPGTYQIWVNGIYKTTATMRPGGGYPEYLYFESMSGSGTFWIDDINDSLY